jgi:hypothetical protein
MPAAGQLFTNNAVAILDASLTPTSTTIQVQPGHGALFPAPTAAHEFFLVTLESAFAPTVREIVKVSARSGDVLTVAPGGRGWEGTTPQAWSAGDTLVDHRVTAGTLRSLQGNFGPATTGVSVPVAATQGVNTLTTTGPNQSCKWLVTIKTADNRVAMTEVVAVYKAPPNAPSFTQYGLVGDPVSYAIDVTSTLTDMTLQVTNNDTVAFTSVDVIRLQHYT